jgi:hypothetical protein
MIGHGARAPSPRIRLRQGFGGRGGEGLPAETRRAKAGRGEGLYEFQSKLRAPLTRLAALATLSPAGRGEEVADAVA